MVMEWRVDTLKEVVVQANQMRDTRGIPPNKGDQVACMASLSS